MTVFELCKYIILIHIYLTKLSEEDCGLWCGVVCSCVLPALESSPAFLWCGVDYSGLVHCERTAGSPGCAVARRALSSFTLCRHLGPVCSETRTRPDLLSPLTTLHCLLSADSSSGLQWPRSPHSSQPTTPDFRKSSRAVS